MEVPGKLTRSPVQPKFAPKIPARRNKPASTEAPKPQEEAPSHGAGRGRGRGRGRAPRPRLEESMVASGPFALGPAARAPHCTGTSAVSITTRGGGGFDSFSSGTPYRGLKQPKTDFRDVKADDATAAGESMTIDDEQFEDLTKADVGFDPADIWAPVSIGGPQMATKREDMKKERKIKIKAEEGGPSTETIDLTEFDEDRKPAMFAPSETAESEMYFFQFPSVLPRLQNPNADIMEIEDGDASTSVRPGGRVNGIGGGAVKGESGGVIKVDPDGPTAAGGGTGASNEKGPEGKVGKLIYYKSGKVKLRIGDIYFDVAPGSESTFLQNVVAVDPDDAKTYLLGNLTRRFVCTPDIEMLLGTS
ncbi:hypothetical protein HDV00_011201 [Rhizophlyctis rosea]|nr:hypothetical protein HDV00_011201 [Rhizophlyctis rosea]